MRTTILGGILFIIPLAFLAIAFTKIYHLSLLVAKPLDDLIPVHRIAGVAFLDVLAIGLILLLCYLAGLIARGGLFRTRMQNLDSILIEVIPGYAVAKGVLSGVATEDAIDAAIKPVLVRFDDYEQIAFEIERDAERATLFLPGAPAAWSGSVAVVALDRVRPLNLPLHKAAKLQRVLGRGTLDIVAQGPGEATK